MYHDNQVDREITNSSIQHDRIKHIEVDRYFIKEKLNMKLIDLPFVLTHTVLAELFCKSPSKLRLEDIFAPT